MQRASKAIRSVFEDTTVGPEKTKASLLALREEINEYINALSGK